MFEFIKIALLRRRTARLEGLSLFLEHSPSELDELSRKNLAGFYSSDKRRIMFDALKIAEKYTVKVRNSRGRKNGYDFIDRLEREQRRLIRLGVTSRLYLDQEPELN